MPTLTRWFIKSSMLYLIAAMILLLLTTLNAVIKLPRFVAFLNFHLLVVGWVTEMIFGVIYWMFPIIKRANPRGSAALGWATYICLNIGLLLRTVGEPWLGVNPKASVGWVLVLSALLQWLAAVFFLINSWPRIKERYRGE